VSAGAPDVTLSLSVRFPLSDYAVGEHAKT